MAYWGKVNYKVKPSQPITLGDGVNTYGTPFSIKQSEARYNRNTTSRNYPALSVKPGNSESFVAITKSNALGQRNNEYPHVIDGAAWKRWDGSAWQTVQGSLTDTTGKIFDFATGTTLYSIMVNGTSKYAWDGSTVTDLTQAPASKLYTTHKGRLYALLGKELKFSALQLINDWSTMNDAGGISITNAKGNGSGITEFADHIVCFTEQSMHELYGTGPLNYELIDVSDDGCISDRSIISTPKGLYWLDYGWIKKYTGSQPTPISHKVKDYIDGIKLSLKEKVVGGKLGNYLYWTIPYGADATENNLILEYDAERDIWNVHTSAIVDFVNIGEKLYGLGADGKIYDMYSNFTAAVVWEHITGPWWEGTVMQKKAYTGFPIIVDLPAGSTLAVYASSTVDGNDFVKLKDFTASANEQNTHIDIPITLLQTVDWLRLKFSGTGPCTIHYLEKDMRVFTR